MIKKRKKNYIRKNKGVKVFSKRMFFWTVKDSLPRYKMINNGITAGAGSIFGRQLVYLI